MGLKAESNCANNATHPCGCLQSHADLLCTQGGLTKEIYAEKIKVLTLSELMLRTNVKLLLKNWEKWKKVKATWKEIEHGLITYSTYLTYSDATGKQSIFQFFTATPYAVIHNLFLVFLRFCFLLSQQKLNQVNYTGCHFS